MPNLLAMENLHVELDKAHLASLAASPKTALAEIVWNSIDADAKVIRCTVDVNSLGSVDRLTVADNGIGIAPDNLKQTFGTLGHSTKRLNKVSEAGRAIHGENGRGRWAALGIGQDVRWTSTAESVADGRVRFSITANKTELEDFRVTDPSQAPSQATGCTVEVFNVTTRGAKYLESAAVEDDLLSTFALQIEQYGIELYWRDTLLNVELLKHSQCDYSLELPEIEGDVTLTVVEWKRELPRHLNLCDASGIALHQMKAGIQAPGHSFTAYLKWQGFADEVSILQLEDQAPEPIPSIIAAAQQKLREHFAEADQARSGRLIKAWQADGSYPFREPPKSQADVAARGIFDIVAVAAAPVVAKTDQAARRLSLELLKSAIETSPSHVRHILEEVLKLPPEQVESFSELLNKTSLESLLKASEEIVGRLEFLTALEEIVNDPALKKLTKERSQLHKLVAGNTWIFREEYALTANDNALKTALKAHVELLGRDGLTPDDLKEPVVDADGRVVIVDLMLSGAIEQQRDHREHLVIELKRPSVSIGKDQLDQIEGYAQAVANDARFAAVNTRWEFWIVGDEVSDKVRHKLGQGNLPPDVFQDYEESQHHVTIHAVTWAQIIQNARHRLKFVRDKLAYDPTTEASLNTLRERHSAIFPTVELPGAVDDDLSASDTDPDATDHD